MIYSFQPERPNRCSGFLVEKIKKMKNKMKKILIFTIFLFVFAKNIQAAETYFPSANLKANTQEDKRAEILQNFLTKYNSPFAYLAWEMVQTADKYSIDYRLLPAISGVESSFGKRIPKGSFNAYGWNGGNYYFDSWENSFEVVLKALKEKYFNRGLNTPNKISPVYCPPNPAWGNKVNFFMEKIESFEKENVVLDI